MHRLALVLLLALGTSCGPGATEHPVGPAIVFRMSGIPLSRLRSPLHIRIFDSTAGFVQSFGCDRTTGLIVRNGTPPGNPFVTGGTSAVADIPGGAVDPIARCSGGTSSPQAAVDECIGFAATDPFFELGISVAEGDYFILVEGTGVLPNGATGLLASGCTWVRIDAAAPPDPGTPTVLELREQR
jgi:hypothetical protein